jgi:hypothetical protein
LEAQTISESTVEDRGVIWDHIFVNHDYQGVYEYGDSTSSSGHGRSEDGGAIGGHALSGVEDSPDLSMQQPDNSVELGGNTVNNTIHLADELAVAQDEINQTNHAHAQELMSAQDDTNRNSSDPDP